MRCRSILRFPNHVAIALLLASTACKGEKPVDPSIATTSVANSSTSLTGVAGRAVSPPPSVIVKDQNAAPMGGATVTFLVLSGGGSASGASVTTDASGIATVGAWTLGTTVGANELSATVGGLPAITFTATGTAGSPASFTKSAGDNQSGTVGTSVAVAPSVTVKDANGNPTPGVAVTFAVASGGGSITGGTSTTNAAGLAAIGSWTLGTTAGSNTLTASATGVATVTFTATGTAGTAASLTKSAGDNQSSIAGALIAVAPSVVVKDANGNPTSGVVVTFAVASGGGSVAAGAATSNAAGVATVGSWTLGPAAGSNTLTAWASGVATVTFTATGTAGAAASLTKSAGDNQSAAAGAPVAVPPSVTVRDTNGNPTSGVAVTFAVASGGGSVTGGSAATNASGVATVGSWTLGSTPGINTLSASAPGLAAVTFTASGIDPRCAARTAHSLGTTTTGTLATSDCKLSDGTFAEFFPVSLGSANAYRFRESATFDTYMYLTLPDGSIVAENDDEAAGSTNSGIKALLPPGSYLIGASSFDAGVTGDFSISSSTVSTAVSNCEIVFVVKGVSTTQNIETTDCLTTTAPAPPIYGDAYFIFLRAGQSMTVTMTSSAVDSFLDLVRLDGVRMTANDDIDSTTKNARIVFTAATSTYYTIYARTAVSGQTGSYTLTIQ